MKLINTILLTCILLSVLKGQHPSLSLTPVGVERIQAGIGSVALFDQALKKVRAEVDHQLSRGKVAVPIPKDMAGGYTHEQHKFNYKLMYKAGNLYQITEEEKYAELVKKMLFDYAKIYPSLPLHPTMRSYATGKIFWQCLNDANWLVFTSQAYDCIYDYLSPIDRKHLEEQLFIPFANFLSIENPKFFNRIHNHSTWANAAVGMIAIVMNNDTLLHKALYGLKNDGIRADAFDNDGGFIKKDGVTTAGFLAQLEYSFAPSGYFAEGPYYLRYAIFPFLKFSQSLFNARPELDIFNYRDGILRKATHTLLQLTDSRGHFFPINDAQKGMSFHTYELVTAVDLMYYVDQSDSTLLNWAAAQGQVSLDESGFITAQALEDWTPQSPEKASVMYSDGANGESGGVAVLRSNNTEVLFKYSTQGMGHGHFDRLSYAMYDARGEVVQDYGAVRWVNIDQKAGGRYLPENKTFGKQTIGHNTLVVNEQSHFDATIKDAEQAHPELYYADLGKQSIQMISAIEDAAYDNTSMHRTLFLIEDTAIDGPLLIDILRVRSTDQVTLDLPLWYIGDYMSSSLECPKSSDNLSTLGQQNGYQHIWQESGCAVNDRQLQFNWLGNDNFYTYRAVGQPGDSIFMGRLGANDPNYNLRSDPVLIQRRSTAEPTTFISLIESHGHYSRVTEIPSRPYGKITALTLLHQSAAFVIASFATTDNEWVLCLSLLDADEKNTHQVQHNGVEYQWQGPYELTKTNE